LHLRENADETLPIGDPEAGEPEEGTLQQAILAVLADGGAYFVQQLAQRAQQQWLTDGDRPIVSAVSPADVGDALWDLAWQGRITSDTWLPLRALTGERPPVRARPARTLRHRHQVAGWVPAWPPSPRARVDHGALAGRWSLLPRESVNPTISMLSWVENLFDRYGVVSRDVAAAEQVPGGFAAIAPMLRRMEAAGRVLRGRFVTGLGPAQFAEKSCIERLRELATAPSGEPVALSAGDPANPFGWLWPWPAHPSGIRPARRGGALVVISNGMLASYLSQSGRQLLTFFDHSATADAGLRALAASLKRESRRTFTLENIDGKPAYASPLTDGLAAVGFSRVPKGYAWYGGC